MSDSFSLKAGGNILPSRFIVISGDYEVSQAAAATAAYLGVSHDSTKSAPADGLANVNHAELGDTVSYYKVGDSCLLEAGAAVAAGALLESDASGRGITAAGAGEMAGAIALEAAGAAGELIRVQIQNVRMHA